MGYQNVCGLVFLFLGAGSHCRHDKGRRIAVSYIVLQNHHRAGAALLGADVRLHVCIVNIPSEVFPVFWYDSDQTSYPSICSKSRPFMAGGSCRKKEYVDSIETHLHTNGFSQLTLKVTEQCNMRCKYCIYSEHYPDTKFYSEVYMKWETAKKAVDDFLSHFHRTWERNKTRKPVIAFYGGEPLLGFDVIKKTVEYVKSEYSQYCFNYSITTNGLLLKNKDIANFLKENGFWIVVSLDGTKDNHDRYRVTRGGAPTYDCLMEIIEENFSFYNRMLGGLYERRKKRSKA